MCMADGNWTEFSTNREQTARKAHRCGDCSRTIEPGERYLYAAGKSEGYFFTAKMCAHCWAACQWLSIVCRGWMYGGVWEDLELHFVDEPPPITSLDLGRLLVVRNNQFRTRSGEPIDPEVIRYVAERAANRTMGIIDQAA